MYASASSGFLWYALGCSLPGEPPNLVYVYDFVDQVDEIVWIRFIKRISVVDRVTEGHRIDRSRSAEPVGRKPAAGPNPDPGDIELREQGSQHGLRVITERTVWAEEVGVLRGSLGFGVDSLAKCAADWQDFGLPQPEGRSYRLEGGPEGHVCIFAPRGRVVFIEEVVGTYLEKTRSPVTGSYTRMRRPSWAR